MPRKENRHGTDGSVGLGRLVQMWPTPRVSDYKGSGPVGSKSHKHMSDKDYLCAKVNPTKAGGQLNPTWVEWLMGWPIGWTDLKPLEMDGFHKWLDEFLA